GSRPPIAGPTYSRSLTFTSIVRRTLLNVRFPSGDNRISYEIQTNPTYQNHNTVPIHRTAKRGGGLFAPPLIVEITSVGTPATVRIATIPNQAYGNGPEIRHRMSVATNRA